MSTPDLTVYGAGVWGLSVAFEAARRGARVRVIDPGGVAAGASGGVVGALAPHVPEAWNEKKAFQLDCLLSAEAFWRAVADAGGGDPGFGRIGRVQPLPDATAVERARARETGARELWRGAAEWRVTDSPPGPAPHSPTGYWVHDTLSGRLFPRRATQALADAVRALGGEVLREGASAGAVLWATGHAGLLELNAGRSRLVGAGVKGQAARLGADLGPAPQVYAGGLYIVPHADGTVAVGSTSERDWTDATTTDEQLEALIAAARRLMPVLAEAPVIERWAGVRPRARSRGPMLGAHPDRPGEFIANGAFKIGFGLAPGVARLMADLVLDGRDAIPPDFRPEASL